MKEYIARTGGRYTYADDIENLQELALSMTALFSTCDDFIISGCETAGNIISEGYVWLGGKIRRFDGAKGATYPYYIYESNRSESVTYANEQSKIGRICHLTSGGASMPETPDSTTGATPRIITITQNYAPRLIDKFFGRYAVLLDTPFPKQTIRKDLVLTGKLSTDKIISSKTAVAIVDQESGRMIQTLLQADGSGSVGAYMNGLLVNEIFLGIDGSISFRKQGVELARIDSNGLSYSNASGRSSRCGSLLLLDNQITNIADNTDQGAVRINYLGYEGQNSRYRNFEVYDGRGSATPLLAVSGSRAETCVNGTLSVCNVGQGIALINSAHLKSDNRLTNAITWCDSATAEFASIGFLTSDSFDFAIRNTLGGITLQPLGWVNIDGDLRIRGVELSTTYVDKTDFAAALCTKVDVIIGKGLSTEDFTSELKHKLEAITTGEITTDNNGYVTAASVAVALQQRLSVSANLSDVNDKSAARNNLDLYSRSEASAKFLTINNCLSELVNLTADEINELTAEQAAALKAKKQGAVREMIDAEQKGLAALRLSKNSNLSDLVDKDTARKNLCVYSTEEVDRLLNGKLGTEAAYPGVVFTEALRSKLEGIKSGNFAYIDADGKSQAKTEGYVSTSQVEKELAKKADRLLAEYSPTEKNTIAENLSFYSRTASDERYGLVSNLFQDYIDYLTKQGKTASEAQNTLQQKLDVPSSKEVKDNYLRRDSKLSDLMLASSDAKKQVCKAIGAAYAAEYEPKINDTGWMPMAECGGGTSAHRLYIRQIGNIVSIQGTINTARREGSNMGGIVAVIPNKVQPPKYGLRCTAANWNDDHVYNRGTSFTIDGGGRNVYIFESGMYNQDIYLNFTYFV